MTGGRALITDKLVEVADGAVEEARGLVDGALASAASGLVRPPGGPLLLENEEGLSFLGRYLGALEGEMRRLCAPYDYRTLLCFSRICTGLPRLWAGEGSVEETLVRCQTADYAALAFGRRDLPDAIHEDGEGGRWFGGFPEEVGRDVVGLHVLSSEYRKTVSALMSFGFLREFSRENSGGGRPNVPAPSLMVPGEPPEGLGFPGRALLGFGCGVGVLAPIQAVPYQHAFQDRHGANSHSVVSRWGLGGFGGGITSLVCLYMEHSDAYKQEPYGSAFLFEPRKRGLRSLYEHAERFRGLFEEASGMPPAHLCALLQGLAQIAFDTVLEEGETGWRSETFFALSGVMLVPQRDLTGGLLLERSAEALETYFPGVEEDADLAQSLDRFVDLVSSAGSRRGPSVRGMRPAYLLHGEAHHEMWAVDFVASPPVMIELFGLAEITRATSTVDPKRHDADVRTGFFDARLADSLAQVEGVGLAFQERRAKPGVPNVRPPTSPGEDLEIDVPLLVGSVFVPVQTRTSVVDRAYEEGDYGALRRRWKAVKDKRRKTDRRYAEKLLGDPVSRAFLRSRGVTHVLPVICGPYAEPVAATRETYWLRPPSGRTFEELLRSASRAVPRVLTPAELAGFLEAADERELKGIAERLGYVL